MSDEKATQVDEQAQEAAEGLYAQPSPEERAVENHPLPDGSLPEGDDKLEDTKQDEPEGKNDDKPADASEPEPAQDGIVVNDDNDA